MKFDAPDGAEQMLEVLERAQKQALIRIVDAAIVSWPQGAKKPKTRQLHNLAGAGALDGAFWGCSSASSSSFRSSGWLSARASAH
jgi:uncharacterized membrane protein